MVATGRSSIWWLRNQALPSTQALLALVIEWTSQFSSRSSQTQPQQVQVALSTIFNSGMDGSRHFSVGGGMSSCLQISRTRRALISRFRGTRLAVVGRIVHGSV